MARRIEQRDDPPVLLLDVVPPTSQLTVIVIGRRVGQCGERVRVRPVAGGVEDPVETVREIRHTRNGGDYPPLVGLDCHDADSFHEMDRTGECITPVIDGCSTGKRILGSFDLAKSELLYSFHGSLKMQGLRLDFLDTKLGRMSDDGTPY